LSFGRTVRFGRVVSFDARRGWGTVGEAEVAEFEFEFHATAIADGSRRIEPGTAVVFTVESGHRGRYEAREVTVLSGLVGESGPSGEVSASHHEPA
jgi:cold shock CspA family protein